MAQRENEPQCFLHTGNFGALGATTYLNLKFMFPWNKLMIFLHDYGCAKYLTKHPEDMETYDQMIANGDECGAAHFVMKFINKIFNSFYTTQIRVNDPIQETDEKIREITQHPRFQSRFKTIETIRDNFQCNEEDFQYFTKRITELETYSGTVIMASRTLEGGACLLITIFSID